MKKKIKSDFSTLKLVSSIVLAIYALIMISLLLWGFVSSFKTNREFSLGANPNILGWPREFTFENYDKVIHNLDVTVRRHGVKMQISFVWQIIYTLIYSVGGCMLSALAPFLVAYACSKFRFKFNKVIEIIVVITMSLPIVGSEAAMVSMLNNLGVYDTLQGVMSQKFSFANMYFLIYYASLRNVSKEYSEAACIDGANEMQIMVKIIFPIVRSLFFTVALLYFIQYWNDYQTPLMYMPSYPTLSYGIFDLTSQSNRPASAKLNYEVVKLAGAIILVFPILVIFIILKKNIMTNLSLGGVKE